MTPACYGTESNPFDLGQSDEFKFVLPESQEHHTPKDIRNNFFDWVPCAWITGIQLS